MEITTAVGMVVQLPQIVLLSGDADNSSPLNILDLTIVAANFNMSPPQDVRADLDGNGIVNIFDLAWVGLHFGSSLP